MLTWPGLIRIPRIVTKIVAGCLLGFCLLSSVQASEYQFRGLGDPFVVAPKPTLDDLQPQLEPQPPQPLVEPEIEPPRAVQSNKLGNVAASGAIDQLLMLGYVGNADKACALVSHPGGLTRCLPVNSEILGHTLIEVLPTRIKLRSKQAEELSFYLKER